MSMLLMVAAMKAKLGNPIRKLVLIKLADNANDDGICWPSYRHIADQCEIDRKTAIRHVEWLEENNFLSKQYRKDDDRGNKSNVYRIDIAGGIAHLVAQNTQPGGIDSPPPGGTESPRTSHSFESISEPVNSIAPSTDGACKVCMGFGDNAEYYGDKCNHCKGTGKEPLANPDQPSPSKAGSESDLNTDKGVRRTDKPNSYPDEFEWIWKNKPGRIGANPKKKAYSACKARIKSGSTWREMAEGMKRYTVHCQSEGKLNTQYVMQMATFFGPDEHFKEQWSVQQPQAYQAPGSEQTGVDAPIYPSQIKNFSSANQTEEGQQQNEKIRQGLGSLRSQLNGEAK